MRNTLIIETATQKQIETLLSFLKEIGIKASVVSTEYSEETQPLTMVSEPSLGEAWNSKEDERWDNIYSNKQ